MVDSRLLEMVVCPMCHGKLYYDPGLSKLICKLDAVYYPIRDGIPVLLAEAACPIS